MAGKGLLQLHVENFRCLRRVTVELGRLNVLVGPNASGKSTLLDVIQFLGDSVREDLGPALDKRKGFDRLVYRGDSRARHIKVGIQARVTRHSSANALDEYELTLKRLARGRLQREEQFSFKRFRGLGRRIKIQGSKVSYDDENRMPRQVELLSTQSLGLSTLPRLSDERGGEQVRQIAGLFSTFRVFEISVAAARRPSAKREGEELRPDASNLSSFLWELAKDEVAFERLQEDARELVPGLEEVVFRDIGGTDEAIVVDLVERGLKGQTPLADASYGTVRALGLLALLYDPKPPLLTCVEEIDHGLHPHVFDLLVERLREASKRTQFLIATHSPALVNRLDPHELIVCEKDPETGASRVPAVDPDDVMRMKGEAGLGLGELWFSGTLGGVP